jgi:hypothetical protein
VTLWDAIAAAAERGSPLWGDALRSDGEREAEAVFSPLADDRFALGVETIYEGYLVHYGTSRLFAPDDEDVAILLGDFLYANGLVHVAELGEPAAVATLADLIARCARLRAEGAAGDGEAWLAAMEQLGGDGSDGAAALAAHARRVG